MAETMASKEAVVRAMRTLVEEQARMRAERGRA